VYIYICLYKSVHVYIHIYIYIYTYICKHIYINTHISMYVYVYIYVYIHTYIYTCTYIHIYIWMCVDLRHTEQAQEPCIRNRQSNCGGKFPPWLKRWIIHRAPRIERIREQNAQLWEELVGTPWFVGLLEFVTLEYGF